MNPAAVAGLVQVGATACSSLVELAGALQSGALLVDQSTGDPKATQAMVTELALLGVALIDAPVSGGVAGAAAGTIAIMLGADAREQARIAPVLAAISPNVFHAGSVGAGQVMKLVNNLVSGVQRLMSLEGLALAAKNGIAPERACEILMAGGARNAFFDKQAPHVLKGNLNVNFTLGLMHKDMRMACDLGAGSEVPLFFANQAREVYQMCINEMGAAAQVQVAALVMDRLAGTQVVVPRDGAK